MGTAAGLLQEVQGAVSFTRVEKLLPPNPTDRLEHVGIIIALLWFGSGELILRTVARRNLCHII